MPRRKVSHELPDCDFDELLDIVKKALEHGQELTEQQAGDFLKSRNSGLIGFNGTVLPIRRRGKIVYREPGKAGADLPQPPFWMQTVKQIRDAETARAKVLRRPPRQKARLTERILAIAAVIPPGRGRIKAIARSANCSVDSVRRALRQMQQMEGTPS